MLVSAPANRATVLRVLSIQLLCTTTMAQQQKAVTWESIKSKFVGGPYAGAGGMAVGGGSVGVEEFADDAEAIKAIRLFPKVSRASRHLSSSLLKAFHSHRWPFSLRAGDEVVRRLACRRDR